MDTLILFMFRGNRDMSPQRTAAYLADLARTLCRHPETEWLEFKRDKADPREIGEYISALANAATLNDRPYGYVVWGVEDDTHEPVGTKFSPQHAKKGNEPLETWLLRLLEPKIDFSFHPIDFDGKPLVVLEIACAARHPVRFNGMDYVRVGSTTKPLRNVPEKERALWRAFDRTRFEAMTCLENMTPDEVFRLLDYPVYFDLLDLPLPESRSGIMDALAGDGLIRQCDAGGWDILNLGAVLLAKDLNEFPGLGRKSMRVIQYSGADRTGSAVERSHGMGYAAGLRGVTSHIDDLLPGREVIKGALRRTVFAYPPLAVRELVTNALIHQDFTVTGAGPMVEIFDSRVEITNPGEPLLDKLRLVDMPPRSRNEALVSLMRRFGFSEDRGSGIDKALAQVEEFRLPAPSFEVSGGFTRVVLSTQRELRDMGRAERVWTVYLHACLHRVKGSKTTNATLRERFGIDKQNSAAVSRLLSEAVEAGMIVVANPEDGTRSRTYLPFWAAPEGGESVPVA